MRLLKNLLNLKKNLKLIGLKQFQKEYERSILTMDFIFEFIKFLKERKKYWLYPTIIILFLFGFLIVLSQGTAVAPFIYTIF